MVILSIETSCDETAVSIVEATGEFPNAAYKVLGDSLFSQVDIHREYGGVFPNLAKREHAKTLVPMLKKALAGAGMQTHQQSVLSAPERNELKALLSREQELFEALITFFENHKKPPIDLISVTHGPGLEPTLWVGVNFARALSYMWDIPVIPVNHMEGHILSSIFTETSLPTIAFPALALLISGGHTELVLMKAWGNYTKVGQTRDDAVGEAFDKVARMLGLPYPGGPEIGAEAQLAREKNLPKFVSLPRPMLDSGNLDFSFSGLKTAVRYAIQDKKLTPNDIASIAREFEDSVAEVLLQKSKAAIDEHGVETLIVGGGVSANAHIRETFSTFFTKEYPLLALYFPLRHLSTDNSIMIALAGHSRVRSALAYAKLASLRAQGNLSLEKHEVPFGMA